jgi:addiction module RelB/DinJ family antitoxin
MNSASILIKTDPQIKIKAQKVAEDMGLSLSTVINRYLREFILKKSITFSTDDEQPTEYLLDSLKKSAEDKKAGRALSFKSGKQALSSVDSLIKNDKR